MSALLGRGLEGVASALAAYGRNVTFSEPRPMVPPVGGVVALRYDRRPIFAEVETRWALAQDRVARRNGANCGG